MSIRRPSPRRGLSRLLGILPLLLLLLSGCAFLSNPPTPTVPHTPLDIVSYDLQLPAELLNAPTVGPLPDTTLLHVGFSFKTNQQLLNELGTHKAQKGQGQTLESFANRVGISDKTYQSIKAFFGIENVQLTLNKVHTNLTVDGKAKVFARLFHEQFVIHQLNDRQIYAPTTNPRMPRFIADSLVALTGMDNYSQPPIKRSHIFYPAKVSTAYKPSASISYPAKVSTTHNPGADCQPRSGSIPIGTIGQLYGYNNLPQTGIDGAGITINLLEFDGFDKSDLQNYFACTNFRGKLMTLNVNNAPPPHVEGESLLDIETIASLAPAATILDFQMDPQASNGDPMNDVLQAIINTYANNPNSASVLSISWGEPEVRRSAQDLAAIDQSLSLLVKGAHMTVFVAAGDCAAFDTEKYGELSVDFPGSDPLVVAVGGTMPGQGTTNGKSNEQVWSDNSNRRKCQNAWGGGGGRSIVYKRAPWQKGAGVDNSYSNGMRQLPDVSALAFPLAAYIGGQWVLTGGTSAAAPEWAAAMALLNEATIKQLNGTFFYGSDLFYTVAEQAASQPDVHPYRDVTQGNNLFYSATPGWDFASGLGTPNLPDFYKVLVANSQQQ